MHLLGCDTFGADLGMQILAGARQSFLITVFVTLFTLAIGASVGIAAALSPPWADAALSRVIDAFLAFPGLLLAILLASILPHTQASLIVALSITGWTARARFCRTLARQTLTEPYIEAAIASGAGTFRLVARHLWPSMRPQVLVQTALAMGSVVLAEAVLSFLGLGSSTTTSWGRLIADGREYLVEAPHLSVLPGAAFLLVVLGFNLLAEGLRRSQTNINTAF